ncbi:SseB family protein [Pseudarthrobacter sp. PS3-L1]|uniref:SseB family protein n=1 Tax=Pseudarthrobacter sp. PS3-L1 TaxID=3046207 RepID=UPI0024B9279F|nr:SseB family protein [Pseudarthrobacter sp. PS3-L1]MDJ0319229.1 SseB family protein [Pseudarthrobacter sp. PS3-L1]
MTEQPASTDPAPLNELEEKLVQSGESESDPVDVILSFLNSEVYLASEEAPENADANVEPLILSNADGDPVLAVFSHPSRVDEQFRAAAPNILGTQGAAIIANIGDELGLVINPSAAFGFEINPEGIANIKRDFRRADEPAAPVPE